MHAYHVQLAGSSLLSGSQVKSSQISFIAWKIRKIGEVSADTAATVTNPSVDGLVTVDIRIGPFSYSRPRLLSP